MAKSRVDLRIAAIAAIALLVAQLGAMTHAYSHVSEFAPAAGQLKLPSGHEFCGDCLNFAPLLAAAAAPDAVALVPSPPHGAPPEAAHAALFVLKTRLAFRSRAPPATR